MSLIEILNTKTGFTITDRSGATHEIQERLHTGNKTIFAKNYSHDVERLLAIIERLETENIDLYNKLRESEEDNKRLLLNGDENKKLLVMEQIVNVLENNGYQHPKTFAIA